MVQQQAEKEQPSWETETGLPNDVDGWITNPRFGFKDEYAQAVKVTAGDEEGVGLMFLVDLVDENGALVGSQGYSVGTGWAASEDGSEITHPKRKNVVGSSRYGELQQRVVKQLKVDMEARGKPTQAKAWEGLGFHWMLEEHPVVGGGTKQGVMPTEFLSIKAEFAKPPTPAVAVSTDLNTKLTELAQSNDVKAFQIAAMKVPGVAANDELMANILDESEQGYWFKHKG